MKRIERHFTEPDRSYFLFGPRGTGKSTLLSKKYPDAIIVDLLDPRQEREYMSRPERLHEIIDGSSEKKVVIIDEVQRVPSLLTIVHSIIFSKGNEYKFILTGSSARKLKRDGSNLLGGRASERHMHPFMCSELADEFSLVNALRYGMLPLLYKEKDPEDILNGYISLYLKEEIKQEGLVRNLDNFSRFLESISFSHGSILNISNVSRDCGVKRKTVENYIEVLEDLLLSYRLHSFTKHAKREIVSHPKFYFFDTGVYQTIRPRGVLDSISEINGPALEGLVAQHLRAWCHYSRDRNEMYFWRTSAGSEVDFIIYNGEQLWAIEVKHAKRIDNSDIRALRTFKTDYPIAKTAIIYQGTEHMKKDHVHCLPIGHFLKNIIPNNPLF